MQGRPGWLYTADAVLVGGAPPSAGSAVLRDYDAADGNTPVGETVGDIQAFDSGGLEGLQDRVDRIPDRLSMLSRADLVGCHGLVNLIAVLLAVAAIATTVAFELDDRDTQALIAMEAKNNAVLDRIAQTQADIVQAARDDRNVRGLNRSSWLRVEPDQSAAPIRKLFPDELVRVRTAQGSWVEVEVFDYGGGSTVGWMPRSALAAPRA